MNRLMRPVVDRVANVLLKPSGQFHDRLHDILLLYVNGWDLNKTAAEIGEEVWQHVKERAPKLRDKAVFFINALEAGLGGADLLRWARESGRWNDDPRQFLSDSTRAHLDEEGTKALLLGAGAGRESSSSSPSWRDGAEVVEAAKEDRAGHERKRVDVPVHAGSHEEGT